MATNTPIIGTFDLATPADFVPVAAPQFHFHHVDIVETPQVPPPSDVPPVDDDPSVDTNPDMDSSDGAQRVVFDKMTDDVFVQHFTPGEDKIVLDSAIFTALADGFTLAAVLASNAD